MVCHVKAGECQLFMYILHLFASDAYFSSHVWKYQCLFLDGKSNIIGGSDTKHNGKSLRGQIIGGGDTVPPSIGNFMIDADLLRLGSVSMSLWRPEDFSSDVLVEALVKIDSIGKVISSKPAFGSTVEGDKSALAVTLLLMNLHLHAVDSKDCPANHKAIYLWASMIWFTSISGVSLVTKRNIVTETIAMMFLVVREDVLYTRYATSETLEQKFGDTRSVEREFRYVNLT